MSISWLFRCARVLIPIALDVRLAGQRREETPERGVLHTIKKLNIVQDRAEP